jgi:hypothetical protein
VFQIYFRLCVVFFIKNIDFDNQIPRIPEALTEPIVFGSLVLFIAILAFPSPIAFTRRQESTNFYTGVMAWALCRSSFIFHFISHMLAAQGSPHAFAQCFPTFYYEEFNRQMGSMMVLVLGFA